jgi:Tol biopolymer transport system component
MVGGGKAWTCMASVAAAFLLVSVPAAQAAFPGANGKIAFVSEETGNGEISVVDPAGGPAVNLTNHAAAEHDPAWSPDGTRIAFTSDRDGNPEIYVMEADGSDPTRLTNDPAADDEAAWSPDGSRIVFTRVTGSVKKLWLMNSDGTGQVQLTFGSQGADESPAWSPDGSLIAFAGPTGAFSIRDIYSVRPDGTDLTRLTETGVPDSNPNWSPDGGLIAFHAEFTGVVTMRPDGSDETPILNTSAYVSPAWSPEGSDLVVADLSDTADFEVTTISEIGTQPHRLTENATNDRRPDWQPLPPAPPIPGYPRPKAATPLQVSLVPASEPCEDPNRVHGPPLAFPSCAPPRPTSSYLTVGTPDANGRAPRSIGSVRLTVRPSPPDESLPADVLVAAGLADVRCKAAFAGCPGGALSDYAGELELTSSIRVTDRLNGHTQDRPATFDRFQFPVTVPCEATADSGVGATCSVATTFNAVLPGVVQAGKRAIWQLGQVQVRDGGEDGLASTDDYTTFAVQGVFVP